jgi:hypothetical protein
MAELPPRRRHPGAEPESEPPELPARVQDARRTTARTDEPRGLTESQLESFRRRLMSDVDAKLEGQQAGIESHVQRVVQAAVKAELAPYVLQLEKLDVIVQQLAEMRDDTTRHRLEREAREKIEAELRGRQDRELELASRLAGIEDVKTKTKETRVEGSRRYRIALVAALVPIGLALAGLAGAAIGSHH